MRSTTIRRLVTWTIAVIIGAPALVACGASGQEPTSLRLLQPNATTVVYIDGWNQDGDEGDRSLVERKPSGMWVVPRNAEYRTTPQGGFQVGITLDPVRGYVIKSLNGTQTGVDSDDCLAEDETYAVPDTDDVGNALNSSLEPTSGPADTSNDDCRLAADDGL